MFLERLEPALGRGEIVQRYVGYFNEDPLSYNFTGLKDTTYYTLFFLGTNEDPQYLLNRLSVTNVSAKTGTLLVDVKFPGNGSNHYFSICLIMVLMMLNLWWFL